LSIKSINQSNIKFRVPYVHKSTIRVEEYVHGKSRLEKFSLQIMAKGIELYQLYQVSAQSV